MRRILEKLYYGEIYRNEEVFPKGEKFIKINGKVGKLENDFTSRLDKAEFRLYDELLTTLNERDSYYYLETFIEGFKIGARMMMEVLSDE
ncbi:MAG: hypothetical protein N4A49_13590 [Marinifilaceae bacterium]|jgi:hypothetical protein|nr:hypothetical protein [Marinifilaceae bacterium]